LPFSIPKLNVVGLGFSDIIPDDTKANLVIPKAPEPADLETMNPGLQNTIEAQPVLFESRDHFENTAPLH